MLKIKNLAVLEIDEVIDNTEEFLKLLSDKEKRLMNIVSGMTQ